MQCQSSVCHGCVVGRSLSAGVDRNLFVHGVININDYTNNFKTVVNEIIKVVDDPYAHLLKINLKNHGFLIGADKLETLEYIIKDITDKHYVKMR